MKVNTELEEEKLNLYCEGVLFRKVTDKYPTLCGTVLLYLNTCA